MASAESLALADQKRILRRAMDDRRSALGPEERARAVASASAKLGALPELRAAARRGDCVAGFAAIRAEIDPAAALEQARADGARVAFPRVGAQAAPGPRLRFHVAAAGDLRPGRFGINEPDVSCPEVLPKDVAVMIVPGLAFDAAGNRLGFGGGYYDEVLAAPATSAPSATSDHPDRSARPAFVVGLAYDFQVVAACPTDARDARVDCVVTDARVIRCSGTPAAGAGRGGAGEVVP